MGTIKTFKDLIAWQEGHKLVLETYKITNSFPKSETFALSDQMKRCSTSITSNIAEGFSRRTNKDKIQFYYISLGSITELQNQLLIAKDLGYITESIYNNLEELSINIHKLVFGLIKYARNS